MKELLKALKTILGGLMIRTVGELKKELEKYNDDMEIITQEEFKNSIIELKPKKIRLEPNWFKPLPDNFVYANNEKEIEVDNLDSLEYFNSKIGDTILVMECLLISR